MKFILTIAFAFFIFTGNVKAAPLHAYYCFNALETANNVVSAFDDFLNSSSSDGMSTHRLYAFPLNGENNITHCIVGEHSGPDQFEKNNNIVNGSAEGQALLSTLNQNVTWVLNGAGTPILSAGEQDPNAPVGILIDIKAKDSAAFVKSLGKFLSSANPNGSITVFADTFTGVDNRTHYVVINGSSLEEAMSNLDSSLATPDGQNYLQRANKFRKVMSRSLIYLVKSWEK